MKDCKDCIWYGKEKPGQCGNYLCRNQSEYDPRTGVEEEAVNDYIKRADVLELVMRGNLVSNRNYKSVMRLIMGIPAADVRPVVRGKWLNDFCGKGRFSKRIVQCSLCGNFLDLDGVNAGRGDANYCPNCGADMREE